MVLVFGLASLAKAQHTVSVSSAPRTDYSNVGETFAATDIAEALATDTASLHELIMKEGGGAIYLSIADGATNEYTGNTNEFWLNGEGAPVAYGAEGCCWFVGITYNDPYVDEETQEKVDGKVYVYTGQYPDFFKKIYDPSVLKCQLAIVSGEKKVTFDITQNVEAARKSELAEADTLLSKLNIVADYEVEMPFVTGKQYEGKTATVAMSDLYEKLGAGVEDLDAFKADLESALTDHIFAECSYFKKENDVSHIISRTHSACLRLWLKDHGLDATSTIMRILVRKWLWNRTFLRLGLLAAHSTLSHLNLPMASSLSLTDNIQTQ